MMRDLLIKMAGTGMLNKRHYNPVTLLPEHSCFLLGLGDYGLSQGTTSVPIELRSLATERHSTVDCP
jgi:hypothetical protein